MYKGTHLFYEVIRTINMGWDGRLDHGEFTKTSYGIGRTV